MVEDSFADQIAWACIDVCVTKQFIREWGRRTRSRGR